MMYFIVDAQKDIAALAAAYDEMGRVADSRKVIIAAKDAEIARLREALKPFADIAGEAWADENGWTDAACQKDRVCDWFGPSAFYAARAALKEQADA
ncbi:Uncharacterised protein [Mycobacterium tuberculosis]|nr:Uncharacterised protein [Mycobacterium tuberculosis]